MMITIFFYSNDNKLIKTNYNTHNGTKYAKKINLNNTRLGKLAA